MFKLFSDWYTRKFSDPHAVTLVVILICSFLFIALFSQLLMPVLVALSIAFLLDLPVNKMVNLKLSRTGSTVLVVGTFVGVTLIAMLGLMPIIWKQSSNLLQEVPHMISEGQKYLLTLPEQYPDIIQASQIETFISTIKEKLLEWGEVALKASLNSIS